MAVATAPMTNTTTTASATNWHIGQEVIVAPRTWPGMNRPGGHGKIIEIHYACEDNTGPIESVDVRYTVARNCDRNLILDLVTPHVELERGGRSRRQRKGNLYDPSASNNEQTKKKRQHQKAKKSQKKTPVEKINTPNNVENKENNDGNHQQDSMKKRISQNDDIAVSKKQKISFQPNQSDNHFTNYKTAGHENHNVNNNIDNSKKKSLASAIDTKKIKKKIAPTSLSKKLLPAVPKEVVLPQAATAPRQQHSSLSSSTVSTSASRSAAAASPGSSFNIDRTLVADNVSPLSNSSPSKEIIKQRRQQQKEKMKKNIQNQIKNHNNSTNTTDAKHAITSITNKMVRTTSVGISDEEEEELVVVGTSKQKEKLLRKTMMAKAATKQQKLVEHSKPTAKTKTIDSQQEDNQMLHPKQSTKILNQQQQQQQPQSSSSSKLKQTVVITPNGGAQKLMKETTDNDREITFKKPTSGLEKVYQYHYNDANKFLKELVGNKISNTTSNNNMNSTGNNAKRMNSSTGLLSYNKKKREEEKLKQQHALQQPPKKQQHHQSEKQTLFNQLLIQSLDRHGGSVEQTKLLSELNNYIKQRRENTKSFTMLPFTEGDVIFCSEQLSDRGRVMISEGCIYSIF